jgi:hypothetical protein
LLYVIQAAAVFALVGMTIWRKKQRAAEAA